MSVDSLLKHHSNQASGGIPSFKLFYGLIVLASVYVLFQAREAV